jgi:hypothetical protein
MNAPSVTALALLLALPTCSRHDQPAPVASTDVIAPHDAGAARIEECPMAHDDVQAVAISIDDAYIASHSVTDIVEPLWWSGSIYGSVVEYERCLARFSRRHRLIYALEWYRSEVNNGGHHQFYWNSTGIVWPDALAALDDIGAVQAAAILREASARLGGAPSRDRTTRQDQLERLNPRFDDLDDRFFASGENIDAMEMSYIRAHAADFYYSGVMHVPKRVLELRKNLPGLLSRDGGK